MFCCDPFIWSSISLWPLVTSRMSTFCGIVSYSSDFILLLLFFFFYWFSFYQHLSERIVRITFFPLICTKVILQGSWPKVGDHWCKPIQACIHKHWFNLLADISLCIKRPVNQLWKCWHYVSWILVGGLLRVFEARLWDSALEADGRYECFTCKYFRSNVMSKLKKRWLFSLPASTISQLNNKAE